MKIVEVKVADGKVLSDGETRMKVNLLLLEIEKTLTILFCLQHTLRYLKAKQIRLKRLLMMDGKS